MMQGGNEERNCRGGNSAASSQALLPDPSRVWLRPARPGRRPRATQGDLKCFEWPRTQHFWKDLENFLRKQYA